jgi:hypothetical protein
MKYLAICSWITFYILILLVVMDLIPNGRGVIAGISIAVSFLIGIFSSGIDSMAENKKTP